MTEPSTTSAHGSTVTLSRTRFMFLCLALVILVIAFLICWSKLSSAKHVSELDKVLATEKISAVALINEDAEFTLFDTGGSKIDPCGTFEKDGTKVPDTCDVKGQITHLNTVVVWRRIGSDCQTVSDGNGKKLYDIHTQGSLAGKGKKCHHDAGATHVNVP